MGSPPNPIPRQGDAPVRFGLRVGKAIRDVQSSPLPDPELLDPRPLFPLPGPELSPSPPGRHSGSPACSGSEHRPPRSSGEAVSDGVGEGVGLGEGGGVCGSAIRSTATRGVSASNDRSDTTNAAIATPTGSTRPRTENSSTRKIFTSLR